MTAKMGSGPVGWVLNNTPRNDAEAQEVVEQFTTRAKPALDLLTQHIGAAAAAGDGDCLSLWLMVLRGLEADVERILTRDKAVVVNDGSPN